MRVLVQRFHIQRVTRADNSFMVQDMEAMRESWTDERLDHFRARVDERFDRVDERFDDVDRRFKEVDRRLGRIEFEMREMRGEIGGMRGEIGGIHDRLDSMQRMMFHGVIALSASIVAGFGGMAGLLAVVA
jgi:archaellum component FlaC